MWPLKKNKIDVKYINYDNFIERCPKSDATDYIKIYTAKKHDEFLFGQKIQKLKISNIKRNIIKYHWLDHDYKFIPSELEKYFNDLIKIISCLLGYNHIVEPNIKIFLFKDCTNLQEFYRRKYGNERKIKAYFNLNDKELYLSLNNITERIMVHEFTHIVINENIEKSSEITTTMHEILAQHCEKYFNNVRII